MIRKIQVDKTLIEEILTEGARHAAFEISNGIPDGHTLFKVDFDGDAVVFYFRPKKETEIDNSIPRINWVSP